MKLLRYSFQFILISLLSVSLFEAAAQQKYNNLQEALFSGGRLSGSSGPSNLVWINDGNQYSYIKRNPETQESEIWSYDPATDSDRLIFRGSDHTFPDSEETFNYSSFQWTSDSRFLVFQSNFRPVYRYSGISDYYYYSIENEELNLLVKDAFTAELSPDGSKIGFEREGDLYVYNLNSEKETRLTNSGAKNFYNGRFGWVYEEEFGLVQAWNWSHDSKYIAYWQTDEKDVEDFVSTDYSGTYPEYVSIPYPKVGTTNPTVKIGVLDVETAENTWMDLNMRDGYIPRIYWTAEDAQLAVVWLNRAQTEMELTFHDVNNGKGRLIIEEINENGWIDVFDFFAGVLDYFFFPEDLNQFFWVSERDGYNHIYRFDYSGNLINQVTKGDWEVASIYSVNADSRKIYYTSTEVSPLERHFYSIGFDGSGKKKLSTEPGTHSISIGGNGKYYIDRYSNTETPLQVELWTTEGEMLKKIEDNAAVSEFISQHSYAPKELFSFTTSDGQKLDGSMVKPMDFDTSKQYPLLLNIYGGPGSQGVYNSWESSGWTQWLAQQGYVVVNVNNRGSGGYGGEFEKIVYKNLGHWEAHDFAETAKYLSGTYDWIDGNRVGIRGHSYGGYMSSYSILTHPNVFKVAVVAAPVTDWRLYDTIYAERYMGLLEDNEEGYIKSSSVSHAAKLAGKMFIAHSSMDENVHVQNTMQLVKALTDAGKDADLRIYPPGAHGVAYNSQSFVLLHKTYTDYLDEHLKGERGED